MKTFKTSLVTSILSSIATYFFLIFSTLQPAYAIENPIQTSNNKFGIHIINPIEEEASIAAELVNSNSGDWGYVTFVIQANDRDGGKWQTFFNILRRNHLIPIVRIATKQLNRHWETPKEEDAKDWAEFLNKLNWPVKNRYIIVYNEPNHGKEWGNAADPVSYAQILNQTIDALKAESEDFFVLNAGLDASTPHKPPNYFDETQFLIEMERAVPGVLNKLDGWSSHSYPNPDFRGSPYATGRGTVNTYKWEIELLKQLGVNKSLPIFITETGWRHSEGIVENNFLPNPETVGEYFKIAFENAWSNENIVAVTPFLLDYQQEPFDHFSFRKLQEIIKNLKSLGTSKEEFYPHFEVFANIPKNKGRPKQIHKAELISYTIPKTFIVGETYSFSLTFRNAGQSIWNDGIPVQVRPATKTDLYLSHDALKQVGPVMVEPAKEASFIFTITPNIAGNYQIALNLFHGEDEFDNDPFIFTVEVKEPIVLSAATRSDVKKERPKLYSVLIDLSHLFWKVFSFLN